MTEIKDNKEFYGLLNPIPTPIDMPNLFKVKEDSSGERKSKGIKYCVTQFFREVSEEVTNLNCRRRVKKSCTLQNLKKKFPLITWLPKYQISDLRGDLIAGLTVGLTVIPQSLAYAKIADLPAQYGMYTCIMCLFVYFIFGTSKDVCLGPTAVLSLLTAEFADSSPQLACLLALYSGLIQITMGFLQVGFLIDFISQPIINSFSVAAAVAIVCNQFKKCLGLHGIPKSFTSQFYWTVAKLPETQLWDFIMSLVCIILLFILKKCKDVKFTSPPKNVCVRILLDILWFVCTARNAIILTVAALISFILESQHHQPFEVIGNITQGLPNISIPSFHVDYYNEHLNKTIHLTALESIRKLGIGLFIVPVIGLIECAAIGKAFGMKNGYKIDPNQELLALGFSNIFGSMVAAYPVTASFSRSAVSYQSGVRSPLSNLVTGSLVLLSLAYLMSWFYFIPTSALAGVIIMAVLEMINFSTVRSLWNIHKLDLIPWFVTFFVSLFMGFEYGIIIGVGVSLLFLLYPWAKPHIKIVILDEKPANKQISCADNDPNTTIIKTIPSLKSSIRHENIALITISMGLLFPGVEVLESRVINRIKKDFSVIFDFGHVTRIDFTGSTAVRHVLEHFRNKRIKCIFINLYPNVEKKLISTGVKYIIKSHDLENAIKTIRDLSRPKSSFELIIGDESREKLIPGISQSDLQNATMQQSDQYPFSNRLKLDMSYAEDEMSREVSNVAKNIQKSSSSSEILLPDMVKNETKEGGEIPEDGKIPGKDGTIPGKDGTIPGKSGSRSATIIITLPESSDSEKKQATK